MNVVRHIAEYFFSCSFHFLADLRAYTKIHKCKYIVATLIKIMTHMTDVDFPLRFPVHVTVFSDVTLTLAQSRPTLCVYISALNGLLPLV